PGAGRADLADHARRRRPPVDAARDRGAARGPAPARGRPVGIAAGRNPDQAGGIVVPAPRHVGELWGQTLKARWRPAPSTPTATCSCWTARLEPPSRAHAVRACSG